MRIIWDIDRDINTIISLLSYFITNNDVRNASIIVVGIIKQCDIYISEDLQNKLGKLLNAINTHQSAIKIKESILYEQILSNAVNKYIHDHDGTYVSYLNIEIIVDMIIKYYPEFNVNLLFDGNIASKLMAYAGYYYNLEKTQEYFMKLLDMGLRYDTVDFDGYTLLDVCLQHNSYKLNPPKFIKKLLEKSAKSAMNDPRNCIDVNHICDIGNPTIFACLDMSSYHIELMPEYITILIDYGANPLIKNNMNESFLSKLYMPFIDKKTSEKNKSLSNTMINVKKYCMSKLTRNQLIAICNEPDMIHYNDILMWKYFVMRMLNIPIN